MDHWFETAIRFLKLRSYLMTENVFFSLLALVASIVLWGNGTTQRSHCDLIRAGIWDIRSRQFQNTILFGAGMCFAGLLFATVPVGVVEGFCYMFASGMMAASMRVIVLAAWHGVNSKVAVAAVETYKVITGLEAAVKADLGSEKNLQKYLDATYGKGKVSAKHLIAQRKAREKANAAAQLIH